MIVERTSENRPFALPEIPEDAVLCVDFDDTLIRGDSLWETVLGAFKKDFAGTVRAFLRLRGGKVPFKKAIADILVPDPDSFAWREELVEELRAQKARGREVVLATAAHRTTAEAVQRKLGLFDRTIATQDDGPNVISEAKVSAIRAAFGERPVFYVGDSKDDLPLWKAFGGAAVAPSRALESALKKIPNVAILREERPSPAKILLRTLRAHQWTKNLLLFAPLAFAHRLGDVGALLSLFAGFAAFCAACSAVYVFNDLSDVASDRQHPSKRRRPIASGLVSVPRAAALVPLLLGVSAACAAAVGSSGFAAVLALYLLLTFAYSLLVKRVLVFDVLLLAGLYTIRMVAGAEASATPVSFWLLVFSMFLFISLATLKRFVDLRDLQKNGLVRSAGRAYCVDDLPVLRAAGVSSAANAALVLALYVQSARFGAFYNNPEFFWLIIPALLYGLLRMWIFAERGTMDEDPVLFAVRDRVTWATGLFVLAMAALAKSAPAIPWLAERLWR